MQKVIKVCHIISAFYRYDTRIFWKQCRSLVKAGYDVTLLANDNIDYEIRENVKIVPTGNDNTNRIRRIIFSRRSIYKKAIEIHADIYQIHDPELLPLGLKLLRKGKYVIFDSHEDFPRQLLEKEWIPKIFRRLLSDLAEAYFKKNLKKFSAVLTVTPHIVDSLKRKCDNVHLITNYPIIEENYLSFTSKDYISREAKLCYAGTVYNSSFQHNILNALENIENVKYIIVGTIDENYLKALSKHPAWHKVEFINRVSKAELMTIYQKVTIGVVLFDYSPNVGYKMGTLGNNKIFEYMQSALPIICTDFILWKEIIDKYKCGIYINPHNTGDIRDAIKYLLENKEKAYEMGQNGRLAVLSEYNWNSQEKVYLKIFNEVLKN